MLKINSTYGSFSLPDTAEHSIYCANCKSVSFNHPETGEKINYERGDLVFETESKTYTFVNMDDPLDFYWNNLEDLNPFDNTTLYLDAFDLSHHYETLQIEDRRNRSMAPASMWHILESRRTGSDNEYSLLPCQDWHQICQRSGHLTLAVADGHGADLYCRSQIGARFACEAACEVLSTFSDPENIHRAIKKAFDAKVSKDLADNPLTEEELDLLTGLPAYLAYGTTLVCAHITRDGIYRLHIGDGQLHILSGTGQFLTPLPEDPNTIDGPSSMVDDDACSYMRWDYIPYETEPAAVILFTDGYETYTEYPWQLLELLDGSGLPDALPKNLLNMADNDDDQTVLMAVNKLQVCMKSFRQGFAEMRQSPPFKEDAELLSYGIPDL